MESASMLSLFTRCLSADYVHTLAGGDYAIQCELPTLYLLFEWSDGCEDWHNNLTFLARRANPESPPSEAWYAHRGFLKVWNAMEAEVIRELTRIIRAHAVQSVICVGYSHGAALSLLATESLSRHLGSKVTVLGYGFGSPRLIKGKLPDVVSRRLSGYTTIRNIPDLVTHLPPAAWGYRHIHLVSIGKKGKYGPIQAHTSQAYVKELKTGKPISSVSEMTRSATEKMNASKVSGDKCVFRTSHPITPRR
ncbi:MAG: lipase family protein [Ruminococcaceae bacterium]|nr:lipase family protein [Oscillospiraceae bacterium]